jgi:16S rRNA (adenine1518-N6/adenine1519-N6)-dimethyltransferase
MLSFEEKLSFLPTITEVIRQEQLSAKKSLGQNFLTDLNLTKRIVATCPLKEGDVVLEIGPGPGGLTRALLLSKASKVIVIEKDPRFFPALHALQEIVGDRLTLIKGDALSLSLADIHQGPLAIVANLPYNIGTELILQWFDDLGSITSITVMLQKEVVDRLVALPSTKDYGRLSIMAQWLTEVRRAFHVSPKAFTPPPKVTSSVVTLVPRQTPLYPADKKILEKTTALTFQHRRKMLRSSLRGIHPHLDMALESIGINPEARPETLSIESFCKLSGLLAPFLSIK